MQPNRSNALRYASAATLLSCARPGVRNGGCTAEAGVSEALRAARERLHPRSAVHYFRPYPVKGVPRLAR